MSINQGGEVRVYITTTISIKDDSGDEVHRLVTKAKTSQFDLTGPPEPIAHRLNLLYQLTKRRTAVAVESLLAGLNTR